MNDSQIPQHVAIIPDGNRRWAKEKGLFPVEGHTAGFDRFKEIVQYARSSGIGYVTIWVFSTENWNRSETEVADLMKIIKRALIEIQKDAHMEKARFVHIGRRDRLSKDIVDLIETLEGETKEHKDFCLCIGIDYGGADEVVRAEAKLLEAGDANKHIKDYLDTTLSGVPDLDLVIRTGRGRRTSGFMPLQSGYAEWVFLDTMFPDFDTQAFQAALDEYATRARRFGK